ncbi:MAG: hypothetical protein V3S55_08260 [Nitrospiraceae bacterium]
MSKREHNTALRSLQRWAFRVRPKERQPRRKKSRWAKWAVLAFAALAILLVASDTAFAQCAMCRTAMLNSPEGQKLARGFNDGILFLLSVPFFVVGTIAFRLRKVYLGSREGAVHEESLPQKIHARSCRV